MAKTIMVVTGKLDTSLTIKTLLEKNGYEVIVAANADECLKKLKINKPGLFLIVSMMPKEKILETATKLKRVKIAYLITNEDENEELKLYSNVIGFVDEPRDINGFLRKIKEFLK